MTSTLIDNKTWLTRNYTIKIIIIFIIILTLTSSQRVIHLKNQYIFVFKIAFKPKLSNLLTTFISNYAIFMTWPLIIKKINFKVEWRWCQCLWHIYDNDISANFVKSFYQCNMQTHHPYWFCFRLTQLANKLTIYIIQMNDKFIERFEHGYYNWFITLTHKYLLSKIYVQYFKAKRSI